MKDSYYVIFNSRGIQRMLRTERFELNSGEYAVRMEIEVPDEIFVKPVIPTTRVIIPVESVRRNVVVETELTSPDEGEAE